MMPKSAKLLESDLDQCLGSSAAGIPASDKEGDHILTPCMLFGLDCGKQSVKQAKE